MSEEKFFRYFTTGCILIMAVMGLFFAAVVLLAFLSTGIKTMVIVLGLLTGFCWVTVRVANTKVMKKWLQEPDEEVGTDL